MPRQGQPEIAPGDKPSAPADGAKPGERGGASASPGRGVRKFRSPLPGLFGLLAFGVPGLLRCPVGAPSSPGAINARPSRGSILRQSRVPLALVQIVDSETVAELWASSA